MAEDKKLMANITPFGLRMQPDLKSKVEAAAQENNRSLNAEIVTRLETYEEILKDSRKAFNLYSDAKRDNRVLQSQYDTLKVERDAAKAELEILREEYEKLRQEQVSIRDHGVTLEMMARHLNDIYDTLKDLSPPRK